MDVVSSAGVSAAANIVSNNIPSNWQKAITPAWKPSTPSASGNTTKIIQEGGKTVEAVYGPSGERLGGRIIGTTAPSPPTQPSTPSGGGSNAFQRMVEQPYSPEFGTPSDYEVQKAKFESLSPIEKVGVAIPTIISPIGYSVLGDILTGKMTSQQFERREIERMQAAEKLPIISYSSPSEFLSTFGQQAIYAAQSPVVEAELAYGLSAGLSVAAQQPFVQSIFRVANPISVAGAKVASLILGGAMAGIRGYDIGQDIKKGDISTGVGKAAMIPVDVLAGLYGAGKGPIKYGTIKGEDLPQWVQDEIISQGGKIPKTAQVSGLYYQDPFNPYASAHPLVVKTPDGVFIGNPPPSALSSDIIKIPSNYVPDAFGVAVLNRPGVYEAQGFTLPQSTFENANEAMGRVDFLAKGQTTPSLDEFKSGTQYLSKEQLQAISNQLIKDPQFVKAYGSKPSEEQILQFLNQYNQPRPYIREPGDLDTYFNKFGDKQIDTLQKAVYAANTVKDVKNPIELVANDEGVFAKMQVSSGLNQGAKVFEAHYAGEDTTQIAKTPWGKPSSLKLTKIGDLPTSGIQEQYTNKLLDASLKWQTFTADELRNFANTNVETFIDPNGQVITRPTFNFNEFQKVYGTHDEYTLLWPDIQNRGVKDILDLPSIEAAAQSIKSSGLKGDPLINYQKMFPGVQFPGGGEVTVSSLNEPILIATKQILQPSVIPSSYPSGFLSEFSPWPTPKFQQSSFLDLVSNVPSPSMSYGFSYWSPPYSPPSYPPSSPPSSPPSYPPSYPPSSPPSSPPSYPPSYPPTITPPIQTPGLPPIPMGEGMPPEPVGISQIGPNVYYNELALAHNIIRSVM